MKKTLCALLFATNLFGLNPSAISKLDNPSEEQIIPMLNDAFANFETFKNIARNEVEIISRAPNEHEKTAVSKFVAQLSSPIDEVRIIDAQSFINGLYLDRQRKDYLIQLLSNDREEDVNQLFREFADKTEFSDIVLKNKVTEWMIKGSNSSDVYKNLMIAYIARTEARHSICARYIWPPQDRHNKIEWFERSRSTYGLIDIKRKYDEYIMRSYFKSKDSINILAVDKFGYLLDIEDVLFHEIGHSTDFFSYATNFVKCDKTIELIVPDFFNLITYVDRFDEIRDEIKKEMEAEPEALQDIKDMLGIEFKNIDEYLDYTRNNLNNRLIQAKILLTNSSEAYQIFGTLLLEDDHKKTLYINMMSDFALSLSKNTPIRMDHLGALKADAAKDDKKHMPFVQCYLPVEIYGSLMEVHGTTLSAYVLRLMYPFGISSILQNEYRLNKPLIAESNDNYLF